MKGSAVENRVRLFPLSPDNYADYVTRRFNAFSAVPKAPSSPIFPGSRYIFMKIHTSSPALPRRFFTLLLCGAATFLWAMPNTANATLGNYPNTSVPLRGKQKGVSL
jgi:hypothetical protein